MEIPQEFDNKTKEELYGDIVMLSHYVTKLKGEIENVQAEYKLKNGEVIKQRSEILQLKSLIGHQNIHINNIQQDNNIIDIPYETDRD
jgi:hypothetical protein